MHHSILNSPLTSINVHQIDIVFPCMNITVPILDSVKGSDIVQLISNKGFCNYVICRNSNKIIDSYDLLYCGDPPEPQLVNLIDKSLPPFLTSQISSFFIPSKIITSNHQRIALFVFSFANYYDMFAFRYNQKQINSPFQMKLLFKKPEIPKFLIRLTTQLIIQIKLPMTSTVLELKNKTYERICQIYPDSNICDINFFRLFSTFFDNKGRRFPDPSKQLKDDNVILDCLKAQKKNPNQAFLFITICPISSNFDKSVLELTKELDLCTIPMTDEIVLFNTDISFIRSEINRNKIKMLQENSLMAKMTLSDSEPVIPSKKIDDQYVIMKAELNTGSENNILQSQSTMTSPFPQISSITQSSVSSMAIAIKVTYDKTANDAIKMFLEKLRSMRRNTRFSDILSAQDQQLSGPSIRTQPSNRPMSYFKPSKQILQLGAPLNRKPPLLEQQQNTQQNQDTKVPPFYSQPNPNSSETQTQQFTSTGNNNDSTNVNDPNDYVLTIGPMDEVLAGDIKITRFVGVRHFIASGQQILSVNLKNKVDVIKSIQDTEINKGNQIEINPKMTSNPIVITKYPTNQRKEDQGFIPHFDVKSYPKIEILHALNINASTSGNYFLQACLIYGLKLLCQPVQTKIVQGKTSLIFEETLVLPIRMSNIPREAKLSLTIYKNNNGQIEPVATSNSALYRYTGWIENGYHMKKMWRDHGLDYFLTTCESDEDNPIIIFFNLPKYQIPVYFIPPEVPDDFRSRATLTVPQKEKDRIEKLRTYDALTPLTPEDKKALWNYRTYCFMYPELLSLMLDSIDYSDPEQVKEIPLLIKNWSRPSAVEALSLLDAKYPNIYVRAYAVECLGDLNDNEVLLYLLQLVQVLKYELYENSPLAQFLIKRGLNEPRLIGHQLFWQLMSEAHLSNTRTRFSLMIVNFMYGIGSYREELINGFKFTQELVKLNKELSSYNIQTVQEPFREALKKIKIPKEFHLPVDSRLVVDSFIIDKCKVMNSKKKPFFLVFKNAAPFATAPVLTIFKEGDDLRQDQLILQIMKIMEHLWRKENLEFGMRCYGVLPTGFNQGFIEVVPNAVTESDLYAERGLVLYGIFNKQIYVNHLKSKNPSDQKYEEARRNFLSSLVGYCVATCVLGVTDRHPGNIMVQDDGHFFHIDFGHFLGNFKKKNGVQTEKAPFHFNSSYVHLLDGKKSLYYKTFLADSVQALNVLRKNARLLITLLVLMIGTGIPELQKLDDINYFKDMLFLNLSDQEVAEKFKELTKDSLKSCMDWLKATFHIIKMK